jgi:ankyrin repeat protein
MGSHLSIYRSVIPIPDIPPEGALSGSSDPIKCKHPYLRNVVTTYVCINCSLELIEGRDDARIALERECEGLIRPSKSTCMSSTPPFRFGISIEYLLAFTKKHDCWSWTASEIVLKIIKPMTEATRCRYVELKGVVKYSRPAKTYVSYAHAGAWGDIVAAILDGGPDLKRMVWMDIFSCRQWPGDKRELEIIDVISHCDFFFSVCSYVESVDNEKRRTIDESERQQICFCRLNCLAEICLASRKFGMVIVIKCGNYVLGQNGSVLFKAKPWLLHRLCTFVDVDKADITMLSEKERVLSLLVDNFTDCKLVNSMIRRLLTGACRFANVGQIVSSRVPWAACGDRRALGAIRTVPADSICSAAAAGYYKLLEFLIKKHPKHINAQDRDELTPISLAATNGHLDCVELLITKDADLNAKIRYDLSGKSKAKCEMPLIVWATKHGYTSCVRLLLARGVDVNTMDMYGKTALIHAAKGGFLDCVDLIIAAGAVIDARVYYCKPFGWTALMFACKEGHDACVDTLISKGAQVNAKGFHSKTVLMIAAHSGHKNCVELLIEHGADLHAVDKQGWSALMYSSGAGHFECVEVLTNRGAEVNSRGFRAKTALHLASKGGSLESVDILISRGIDVLTGDKYGWTSLMHAAHAGHTQCVNILIDKGADYNAVGCRGENALIVASKAGHSDCVELLLSKGASIGSIDNTAQTALIVAASRGHIQCVELLIRDDYIDLNIEDKDNRTALMYATDNGHLNCVDLLTKKAAEIYARERGLI